MTPKRWQPAGNVRAARTTLRRKRPPHAVRDVHPSGPERRLRAALAGVAPLQGSLEAEATHRICTGDDLYSTPRATCNLGILRVRVGKLTTG